MDWKLKLHANNASICTHTGGNLQTNEACNDEFRVEKSFAKRTKTWLLSPFALPIIKHSMQ